MTRQAWRDWQAQTVELLAVLVGVVMACALVGRARVTHHRQANPSRGCMGHTRSRSTRRSCDQ